MAGPYDRGGLGVNNCRYARSARPRQRRDLSR